MQLSNRILASFIIVFIIAIIFGTQFALKEINRLTGSAQATVSIQVAVRCGDNFISDVEVCDGGNLSNQTCVSRGFDAGTLVCLSDCRDFDTSQCSYARPVGGVSHSNKDNFMASEIINYDSDSKSSFDFALTAERAITISFADKTYSLTLDKLKGEVAILKVMASPPVYYEFYLGQTKPLDLNKDRILDFYFKLIETSLERAVFNVKKIESVKSNEVKTETVSNSDKATPKLEIPITKEDYRDYHTDAILLLIVVLLAIINFIIFKKFITSKK